MPRRSWQTTNAIVVAIALAVYATAGAEPSAPLIVRLYNTAHIPQPELAAARVTADTILQDTGLAVAFRQCGGNGTIDGPTDSCGAPLKSSEIVVRIIDAPTFNATLDPDAYGVAYIVSKDVNRGWLATVFADRIRTAAARVEIEPGVLAGRVMAHEIGHLLLGNDHHGNVGVMQAQWSDAMLTRPGDEWRFTMLEAARLRQIRSLLQ